MLNTMMCEERRMKKIFRDEAINDIIEQTRRDMKRIFLMTLPCKNEDYEKEE